MHITGVSRDLRFLNIRERNLKAEFKIDHLVLSLVQTDTVFLKTELSGKSDNEEITCFLGISHFSEKDYSQCGSYCPWPPHVEEVLCRS